MKIWMCVLSILILFSNSSFSKEPIRAPRLPVVGDGEVLLSQIEHKANNRNYIVRIEKNKVRVLIKTARSDVGFVDIVALGKKQKMQLIESGARDYYFADIKTERKNFSYYFELGERGKVIYYGASRKLGQEKTPFYYDESQVDVETIGNTWAKNSVFYYILIDRFRDGDSSNFSPKVKWTADYHQLSDPYQQFGGDLAGIIEKEAYLSELGVDAVSLSSPFYSSSYHKFDSMDFRHISPDIAIFQDQKPNLSYKFKTLVSEKKVEDGFSNDGLSKKYTMKKIFSDIVFPIDLPKGKNAPLKHYFFNNKTDESTLLQQYQVDKNGYGENLETSTWGYTYSDRLFFYLVKSLHEKGLRVTVNVNLSYVSKDFFAYDLALEQGPLSKYAKWFKFTSWPTTEKAFKDTDSWNPYIAYQGKGNGTYGVKEIDGKRYRRKWLAVDREKPKLVQEEILNWNKAHSEVETFSKAKKMILLNTNDEAVQQYLTESVLKWVKGLNGADSWEKSTGIDGLSLDYSSKLSSVFLRKLIVAIKAVKSDFYFVEGMDTLQKNSVNLFNRDFDYGDNLNEFIVENQLNATLLDKEFILSHMMQPQKFQQSSIHMLDSLYSSRAISRLINPDIGFGEESDKAREINPLIYSKDSEKKLKMLIILELFYPGNSELFYGDELGQWGTLGIDAQKPMIWWDLPENFHTESDSLDKYQELAVDNNKNAIAFSGDVGTNLVERKIYYPVSANSKLLEFYQKILKINHNYKRLLNEGTLKFIPLKSSDIYGYSLEKGREKLLVIANRGEKQKVTLSTDKSGVYKDVLSGKLYEILKGKLDIDIGTESCQILTKLY